MREVGSLFWFMFITLEENRERIRERRVPFRAESFFVTARCRRWLGSLSVWFVFPRLLALLNRLQFARALAPSVSCLGW